MAETKPCVNCGYPCGGGCKATNIVELGGGDDSDDCACLGMPGGPCGECYEFSGLTEPGGGDCDMFCEMGVPCSDWCPIEQQQDCDPEDTNNYCEDCSLMDSDCDCASDEGFEFPEKCTGSSRESEDTRYPAFCPTFEDVDAYRDEEGTPLWFGLTFNEVKEIAALLVVLEGMDTNIEVGIASPLILHDKLTGEPLCQVEQGVVWYPVKNILE